MLPPNHGHSLHLPPLSTLLSTVHVFTPNLFTLLPYFRPSTSYSPILPFTLITLHPYSSYSPLLFLLPPLRVCAQCSARRILHPPLLLHIHPYYPITPHSPLLPSIHPYTHSSTLLSPLGSARSVRRDVSRSSAGGLRGAYSGSPTQGNPHLTRLQSHNPHLDTTQPPPHFQTHILIALTNHS